MKLTEHFTCEELTKTDVAELQAKNRRQAETLKGKLIRLAEWAETLRAVIKAPMIITSGYRCRYLNTRVGGACGSQHVKAEAIDFRPVGIEPDLLQLKGFFFFFLFACDQAFRSLCEQWK